MGIKRRCRLLRFSMRNNPYAYAFGVMFVLAIWSNLQ